MKDEANPVWNKLFYSALIIVLILVMQPLEVFFFSDKIPVLFPKGSIGLEQRNLLLTIQLLMLLVIVPVYIMTFLFSWWYRAGNKKANYDPHLVDHLGLEVAWWGIPTVLLAVVGYLTWVKTYELDPYKPIPPEEETLEIEAVALEWKWLFLYPEEQIASLNELAIPVGRPVRFRITADAPMNTFWIPRLGGMIYAMPGMQTQLHLIADEGGNFRGGSAHVSGEGFSKMVFRTKSLEPAEFDRWVAERQAAPNLLTHESYEPLVTPTIEHPVEFYRLGEHDLFEQIIGKYMKPKKSES